MLGHSDGPILLQRVACREKHTLSVRRVFGGGRPSGRSIPIGLATDLAFQHQMIGWTVFRCI
eukprot:2952768-Prymnesium_polylepis.1